jgi:TRAP-type C4-dicarboxylate transport system permease small subunit
MTDQHAASRDNEQSPEQPSSNGKISTKDLLQSVFAAALGVQSSKNRERDFNQGNAGIFIVAGIVFTALFIGGVLMVVRLVLAGQ